MSPAEIVTAFIDAINKRDLDGALAFIGEDCEYDNVPMRKVFGPQAIDDTLRPMLAAASEIDWVVYRQVGDGTTVFNERLDRFALPHGWVEVPVTGVWEVRDGRITLWRDYFDLASFRKQMPAT